MCRKRLDVILPCQILSPCYDLRGTPRERSWKIYPGCAGIETAWLAGTEALALGEEIQVVLRAGQSHLHGTDLHAGGKGDSGLIPDGRPPCRPLQVLLPTYLSRRIVRGLKTQSGRGVAVTGSPTLSRTPPREALYLLFLFFLTPKLNFAWRSDITL